MAYNEDTKQGTYLSLSLCHIVGTPSLIKTTRHVPVIIYITVQEELWGMHEYRHELARSTGATVRTFSLANIAPKWYAGGAV